MFDIAGRRPLWYTITAILILPGIIFMLYTLLTQGTILPLNIDYTGGTLWEMRFQQPIAPADIRDVFVEAGYSDTTAFTVGDEQTLQVKFSNITIDEKAVLVNTLTERFGEYEELSYRSIGPAIGREVSRAAVGAVAVASVAIMLYIAWAFRQVSHPFRYGACAIVALVHDALVTISFIGVMNWITGWEVDALFLTAILTVIGYSVNDTIVVFDRIRENLKRHRGEDFATVANRSTWESMQRSLATQFAVFLVVTAVLLFGGASLNQFMATMLVGMVSGTYSTIFISMPLLVAWEEGSLFGNRRKAASIASERAVLA